MTGDEPISWDDYAAERAITEQEAPQGFAAYLTKSSTAAGTVTQNRSTITPPRESHLRSAERGPPMGLVSEPSRGFSRPCPFGGRAAFTGERAGNRVCFVRLVV